MLTVSRDVVSRAMIDTVMLTACRGEILRA